MRSLIMVGLLLNSYPVQAESPELSLTGRVEHVVAIGGESTGFVIQSASGWLELDLSAVRISPREDQLITVTGRMKSSVGVETRSHDVFVATSAVLGTE